MKSKNTLTLAVAVAVFGVATVLAGPNHDMTPYKGSKEFEQIKALEGRWEGTMLGQPKDAAMPDKILLDYHTTSGGSAVVETMSPGTPHEMVTIYTDENGALAVTHYCMMHNQPHMKLTKSSASQIALAADENDPSIKGQSCAMRNLTIDFSNRNELKQTWISYVDGKPQPAAVFTYRRKV